MAGGALDQIVARVESYFGEFLQSRAALLDAKNRLDNAIAIAQRDGTARLGTRTLSLGELNALYAENDSLLNQNADLQNSIAEFKDKVDMVRNGAESVMDYFTPEGAYDTVPGLGAIPVMIPAAALVAAGAVLATTLYIYLGNARKHIAAAAGAVVGFGSDVLMLAVAGFAAYWYFVKRGR